MTSSNRGTFKVILREELPDGANALTARFVLAIKSNADGQVKYKARYVIGGHRDRLKQYLVHGAQALQAFLRTTHLGNSSDPQFRRLVVRRQIGLLTISRTLDPPRFHQTPGTRV